MDMYGRPTLSYSGRAAGNSPRPNTPIQVWPAVSRERDFEAAASIIRASITQPKPTTKTFVKKRINSNQSKDVTFGKNIKIFLQIKSRGYVQEEDCQLCQKKIRLKQFPALIQKSLFKNYSNSIDYYYTKDINDILNNNRCAANLEYSELKYWRENQDTFTMWVPLNEFKATFLNLWKYHQFNIDQPVQTHKNIHLVIDNHFYMLRSMQEKAIKKMLDVMSETQLEQCDIHLSRFHNQKVELVELPYRGSDRFIFTQLNSTHSLGGERSIVTPSLSRIEPPASLLEGEPSYLSQQVVCGLQLKPKILLSGLLQNINHREEKPLAYPYLDDSERSKIYLSSREASGIESPSFLKHSSRESFLEYTQDRAESSPPKKEAFIRMEECAVDNDHPTKPLPIVISGLENQIRQPEPQQLSFKRKLHTGPRTSDKVSATLAASKSRTSIVGKPSSSRLAQHSSKGYTAAFLRSHEELLKIPKVFSNRNERRASPRLPESGALRLQRSKETTNLKPKGMVASASTADIRRGGMASLKNDSVIKPLGSTSNSQKPKANKGSQKILSSRQKGSKSPIKTMLDSLRCDSQKSLQRFGIRPGLKAVASQKQLPVKLAIDPLQKIKEIIEVQKSLKPKHVESQPLLADPKLRSSSNSQDNSARKSRSRTHLRLKSPLVKDLGDVFIPGARITAIVKDAFQSRKPHSTRAAMTKTGLETIKFAMTAASGNKSSRSSSKEVRLGETSQGTQEPGSNKKPATSSLNIYSSEFIHGIIGSRRQQAATEPQIQVAFQPRLALNRQYRGSKPSPSPTQQRGVSSGSNPSRTSNRSSPPPSLSFRPQTLRAPNFMRLSESPGTTR